MRKYKRVAWYSRPEKQWAQKARQEEVSFGFWDVYEVFRKKYGRLKSFWCALEVAWEVKNG